MGRTRKVGGRGGEPDAVDSRLSRWLRIPVSHLLFLSCGQSCVHGRANLVPPPAEGAELPYQVLKGPGLCWGHSISPFSVSVVKTLESGWCMKKRSLFGLF